MKLNLPFFERLKKEQNPSKNKKLDSDGIEIKKGTSGIRNVLLVLLALGTCFIAYDKTLGKVITKPLGIVSNENKRLIDFLTSNLTNGIDPQLYISDLLYQKGIHLPENIIKRIASSIVLIVIFDEQGQSSIGAGFYVDENKIATNHHVVAGRKILVSTLYGEVDHEAYAESRDVKKLDWDFDDIAFISTKKTNKEYLKSSLPFGSNNQKVIHFGFGRGIFKNGTSSGKRNLTITVGSGGECPESVKKEAHGLDNNCYRLRISPGDSGGPILNLDGNIEGINSATEEMFGISEGLSNLGVSESIFDLQRESFLATGSLISYGDTRNSEDLEKEQDNILSSKNIERIFKDLGIKISLSNSPTLSRGVNMHSKELFKELNRLAKSKHDILNNVDSIYLMPYVGKGKGGAMIMDKILALHVPGDFDSWIQSFYK